MQDIRIGRAAKSGENPVTLSTTSQVIVSNSVNRLVLVFCPPSSGVVTISPEVTAVSGRGFVMTPTSPPLILTTRDHGDLPERQWTAIADAGAPVMLVIETMLPLGEEP